MTTTTATAPTTDLISTEEGPSTMTSTPAPAHYKQPDWFTRHVMNPAIRGVTRLGLSVRGSRVLEHRGRTTGELHRTPVNPLTFDGTEYLVAPRGETQWVRNVRHSGGHCVLILGRRRTLCTLTEVPVEDSVPILRAYLRHWKFETGQFFGGISPDATDEEWATEAPRHPVFVVR